MSTDHGWTGAALGAVAVAGILYLVLPILIMFPLSLESGSVLRFPPETVSLDWYLRYLTSTQWIESTVLSFKVALGATLIATVMGTAGAIGLASTSEHLRGILSLIMLSPILLPTIVVAIAVYGLFAALELVGTPLGLILAHAVLTTPFVLLNVGTALSGIPPSLEDAAASLGASPAKVLWQVTLPLVWNGIAAGAVFAFLVSFDEVVIAMFLSGTQAVTLPKRMLDGIFYEMTPMLASVAVLLVIMNVVLALAALALLRMRR